MLTSKQHQVWEFICQYIAENTYAPTTAEIAKGIGIQSRGVVHRYLKALEADGRIEMIPGRRRNIQLKAQNEGSIPLIGSIAAGQPIEAVAQDEAIQLSELFVGQGRYALKVKGDSMEDEGILDGDVVICQYTEVAKNNQIVVALVDRESATLKRVEYHQNGTVTLHPANAKHEPQHYHAHQIKIQGLYVGLLRFCP